MELLQLRVMIAQAIDQAIDELRSSSAALDQQHRDCDGNVRSYLINAGANKYMRDNSIAVTQASHS